jgi:hypothetical protein
VRAKVYTSILMDRATLESGSKAKWTATANYFTLISESGMKVSLKTESFMETERSTPSFRYPKERKK